MSELKEFAKKSYEARRQHVIMRCQTFLNKIFGKTYFDAKYSMADGETSVVDVYIHPGYGESGPTYKIKYYMSGFFHGDYGNIVCEKCGKTVDAFNARYQLYTAICKLEKHECEEDNE